MDRYSAKFEYEQWHPLTTLLASKETSALKPPIPNECTANNDKTNNHGRSDQNDMHNDLSSTSRKVLYDVTFEPELSVRERIEKLNISGRAFVNAKHELKTKGLVIESCAGRKKYLMPKPEVFEAVGLICPYANKHFIEHSFFLCSIGKVLKKNAANKYVHLEYKIGTSGQTGDVVTQSYDGVLTSYELTLSAGNIVQNCLKYNNTAFSKTIFVCRNSDLMRAVRSKIFSAGLPFELLAKIDFMLLSAIFKKQKN